LFQRGSQAHNTPPITQAEAETIQLLK